jgi:SAM-dependent methyltransferase
VGTSRAVDVEWVKQAQRALYGGGEYFALAAVLAPAAEAAVEMAGIGRGDVVLDVAAGDGNAAIAAACRGARVVALDLSPAQVERGRGRSAASGQEIDWVVGDAEELPFADGTFTHVVSVFGVVFAPRPEVATRELFRVCASGGVVAVTAWTEAGYMGELTAFAHATSADDDPFPDLDLGWGTKPAMQARLGSHASRVHVEERALPFDPSVRGLAGAEDCAAAYLSQHLPAHAVGAFADQRERLAALHAGADGIPQATYLLARAERG